MKLFDLKLCITFLYLYVQTFSGRKNRVKVLEKKMIYVKQFILVGTIEMQFFDSPRSFLNLKGRPIDHNDK